MDEIKMPVFISHEVLPESRNWKVGKSYRVKAVLRQVGTSEHGANFELVDVTSLEPEDKSTRRYFSENGFIKG